MTLKAPDLLSCKTPEEANAMLRETIRAYLMEWEKLEDDKDRRNFISELRWLLSHNYWPKKKEGKLTFSWDYEGIAKPTLVQVYNRVLRCVHARFHLSAPGMDLNTLKSRQMLDVLNATVHYFRNTPDLPDRHPDNLRAMHDIRKTLYDGTRVWNEDGTPRQRALVGRPKQFQKHGDGVKQYQCFMTAYEQYDRGQKEAREREIGPWRPREKSAAEVKAALALKNKQREEARRRREALAAEEQRQIQEAKRRRGRKA